MRHDDLIFDVGMHRGEDAAFYLAKGFRVVGFEANPQLVSDCRERFSEAIADGRLAVVEGAIIDPKSPAAREGTVRFYRNLDSSVWGTVDENWMRRNERLGTRSEIVEVSVVDFSNALREFGMPYYLKVDIEGADHVCLAALGEFEEKPEYLSIESEKVSFERLTEEVRLLQALGYQSFCAVQQADIHLRSEPSPAREGQHVGWQFPKGASGPFGRDLPGPWVSADGLLQDYRRVFLGYRMFGDASFCRRTALGRKLVRLTERVLRRPIPGWYDTHARLAAPDSDQFASA